MNCPRCQASVENEVFCNHCGLPLQSAPQGSPGQAPPYGYGPPPGSPCSFGPPPNIPDYLVWSILLTIFCQPIGIAAIIFSVLTMSEKNGGRYDVAAGHSKTARQLLYVGAICLGLIVFFYIAMFAVMISIGIIGAAAGS